MKSVFFTIAMAITLSGCGTIKGTTGGFVHGVGKDITTVGEALSSVGSKIKP